MNIRNVSASDRDAIVTLSLRAWAPVFASLEQVLSPALYQSFFPDWRAHQRKAVEGVLDDPEMQVRVCELTDGAAAGFTACRLHHDDRMGEIHMIAVDPDYQRRGIARALTDDAVQWMKESGMEVVMVETGGDPGHAPARRTYASAGFELTEVARYFRKL